MKRPSAKYCRDITQLTDDQLVSTIYLLGVAVASRVTRSQRAHDNGTQYLKALYLEGDRRNLFSAIGLM